MLRFSGMGVTDVGRVRESNEDSAFLGPYVALVADGVGGAAAGEVASATVAYVVSAIARLRHDQDPGRGRCRTPSRRPARACRPASTPTSSAPGWPPP